MKVFVTGATGLIGNAALRALIAAGHQVTGLTSRAQGVSAIEAAGGRAIVGDMRDAKVYADVAREADAIVHAAASIPNKMRFTQADVDAFQGADAEAVDALLSVMGPGCRAFVFSSGAYVYGDTGPSPVDETHSTENHHLVMRRRLQTEAKLLHLAKEGKVPAVILRPGLIYGNGSLWARLYLGPMLQGRRAMLPGNGRNILSFVHHDDVGEAYRTVLEHTASDPARAGEIYNVADDEPAPLGEVVRAQAQALGAPPPYSVPGWLIRLFAGPFSGVPVLAHTVISNRKLKALGFSCRYPRWQEGIAALASTVRGQAR